MLVMGGTPGTVLRKAQDHRNERPGRLQHLRKTRLDFRPGQREPPRQLLPARIRRTGDDEPEELDRRQRIHREQHDHPFRKPAGGELLDWQKEYNSAVNKIRWMIE